MDTSYKIPDHVDPDMISAGQAVVRDGGTELLVDIGRRATEPSPLDTIPYLELIAVDPAYKAWCEQKTLNFAGPAWAALAGDMAVQVDRLEALRSIAVPTLVIVGEQDDGFVPQSQRHGGRDSWRNSRRHPRRWSLPAVRGAATSGGP